MPESSELMLHLDFDECFNQALQLLVDHNKDELVAWLTHVKELLEDGVCPKCYDKTTSEEEDSSDEDGCVEEEKAEVQVSEDGFYSLK